MRTLLVLLAVFSITTSASKVFAGDPPANLEEVMKALEVESKAIGLQIDNRDANVDSATRSLTMRGLFVAALDFLPEKIEKAKEDEKLALVRLYDKFLAQEIVLTSDLVSNFVAGENDKAKLTNAEIVKVKREAHKLFK